jgi:DNA uptake protein ComE-like DNA-binding protein
MRRNWPRIGHWFAIVAIVLLVPAWAAAAEKSKKPLVDLNTATQKELEELPGVGEATAKKIIAGRPYKSVSDLAKAGVPEKTISKIEKQVTVSAASSAGSAASKPASSAPPPTKEKASTAGETRKAEKAAPPAMAGGKVDLNTASQKELEALPGVGPATAKKIIAGRPYSSVADLSRAGVNASTIDKIGSMVTVSGKSAAGQAAPPPKPAAAATDTSRSAGSSKMASQPASGKPAAEPAAAAPQQPPVKGMVWVNTETKVFHREGDRWYGNTKHGKFMTEADAIKAGYRESKQKVSG